MEDERPNNIHQQYECLGRLTVNFSLLEFYLHFLFFMVSGRNSHLTKVMTSQLSFQRIVACIKSLYPNIVTDQAKQVHLFAVLSKALNMEGNRNKHIHSIWLPDDVNNPTELAVRYKHTIHRKKGLQSQIEQVDHTLVNQLSEDLLKCSFDIEAIVLDLYEFLKQRNSVGG